MGERIQVVGVHAIPAREPCYLIEIELRIPAEEFDFGSITQANPDEPDENWQVAYDERKVIGGDSSCSRWAFFFHYLEFDRPLLSSMGPLTLPAPTPLPDRLLDVTYEEP